MNAGGGVVITGLGAFTPVGNDAAQTAAAVRAGISRLAGWRPGGSVGGGPRIMAAALPENYGDIAWTDKFEDLLMRPMYEALWDAGLYDLVEHRSRSRGLLGLYLATPAPGRAGITDSAYRDFAAEAKSLASIQARVDHVELVAREHTAGLAALDLAVAHLKAEKIDVAVVAGVDSQLHGPHLARLAEHGFLKLPGVPQGLLPGEAAAVLVLERSRDARARKAAARARIGTITLDVESTPLGERYPIRGEAATHVIAATLAADGRADQLQRVITDMSGERWRAIEWAIVETRCLGALAPGWELWHPADCFGDLGAATSVAHAVIMARAFARGYAGAGGVLLFAASHAGERAAATLWPPAEEN
ncbi:MAG TPA: beta-ketoacyl synthase N-terminal-like domain-containing protein [Polyangiaceae bacterium]|nr:beta-ketoacyl synthase N-terminal-like domain-containing protein [Polyangiaceae bacterium]